MFKRLNNVCTFVLVKAWKEYSLPTGFTYKPDKSTFHIASNR